MKELEIDIVYMMKYCKSIMTRGGGGGLIIEEKKCWYSLQIVFPHLLFFFFFWLSVKLRTLIRGKYIFQRHELMFPLLIRPAK